MYKNYAKGGRRFYALPIGKLPISWQRYPSQKLKPLFMRVKLTCFFLLIAFLQISFAAKAQYITLMKSNISLRELFKEIKKQTGYDFVYKYDLVLKGKKVNINALHKSLKEVLDESFEDQPFAYSIESNTVIVFPKNELRVDVPSSGVVQDEVRGIVTDAMGIPLAGATIRNLSDGNSTVSDANGNFVLRQTRENAVLQVSFVGYEQVEINIGNKKTLAIVLKEQQSSLNEVMVVGYGSQRKELVTSAIGSFKVKDEDVRQVASPTRLLEGRIAGVNVSMGSGNLASGERIAIRGTSSISAGNNLDIPFKLSPLHHFKVSPQS